MEEKGMEKNLRELTMAQREWYKNLTEKLKKDCQIKRAVQSAEMHNWMVCMRIFNMSSKELSKYYQQIKNDPLIDEANNIIIQLNENIKKLNQIVTKREISQGKKFSELQLAIAGLK